MRLSPLEMKVSKVVAPVLADMGYTLVHVMTTSEAETSILRIMAEHSVTKQMNLDDAARLSRAVGTVLDVEDIVPGAYRLEMSSPGVDRPLVKPADFVEYAGFEAKIEIDPPLENGQKRFRGRMKGIVNDENVLIETDEGPFELPLYNIQRARLVVTDDLLKAGQEKRKKLKELEEQEQQQQQQN